MAINNEALTDEQRNAFTIAYRFYEKFHAMDGTPEDWKQLAAEVAEANAEGGSTRLVTELLASVVTVISADQKDREDAERLQSEQTRMEIDGRPVIYP